MDQHKVHKNIPFTDFRNLICRYRSAVVLLNKLYGPKRVPIVPQELYKRIIKNNSLQAFKLCLKACYYRTIQMLNEEKPVLEHWVDFKYGYLDLLNKWLKTWPKNCPSCESILRMYPLEPGPYTKYFEKNYDFDDEIVNRTLLGVDLYTQLD